MVTTTAEQSSVRFLADRAQAFTGTPLQTLPTQDYISLSQGTPDLPTPQHAIDAVKAYLDGGTVYYTFHDGMPELRAAIARFLKREHGLDYDPQTEIIVSAGTQEAMFVALFGTLNPGDVLLAADPHYKIYDEVVHLAGAEIRLVPTLPERGFQIDVDALEAAIDDRVRAILVVSPDNPTGGVQSRATCQRIAAIAIKHDLLVFADELYARFLFDGAEHTSIANLPGMHDRTITINGFSKAYAMTGWRVGYLAVPAAMKSALTSIKHACSICAATPSQIAALAILEGPQEPLDRMMAEWSERREYLYDRLVAMGLPPIRTPGSYYLVFDVSSTGLSGQEFTQRLFEEESVRAGAGTLWGDALSSYVRASFMIAMDQLNEGLDRLEQFVNRRREQSPAPTP